MKPTNDSPGIVATRPTEESFLRRFSRRKHEARQGRTESPAAEADATTSAAVTPVSTEDRPVDRDTLTDADMPDLRSLDEQSDYTAFLSAKVSESLRRAALRKLFHSTAFNVVDELDDYNEDFTTFESLGDIVTAEMRHRDEIERRRQLESEAVEESDEDAVAVEPKDPDDGEAHAEATASGAEPDVADVSGGSDATEQQLEGRQDDRSSAPV